MAKKKTPAETPTPTSPPAAAAAPRRRAAPRATADERVQVGDSTTTEPPVALPPATMKPDPSYEQIAEAAYQRYLNRGGSDGRDFDDWIEAERELRER